MAHTKKCLKRAIEVCFLFSLRLIGIWLPGNCIIYITKDAGETSVYILDLFLHVQRVFLNIFTSQTEFGRKIVLRAQGRQ